MAVCCPPMPMPQPARSAIACLPLWIRKNPSCLNWRCSAHLPPTLTYPDNCLAGEDLAIRRSIFARLETGRGDGLRYIWSNDQLPGAVWTNP
jgi:hypothetical protein